MVRDSPAIKTFYFEIVHITWFCTRHLDFPQEVCTLSFCLVSETGSKKYLAEPVKYFIQDCKYDVYLL